ncbi:MAG: ribose 5-phosphate isomerase B [bacterium]
MMSNTNIVAIGSDHAGFLLKDAIIKYLGGIGFDVKDCGTLNTEPVDYPDFVPCVVNIVKNGGIGILICGTGIGMSISANRFNNIRAARCLDTYSAEMARKHNDANVLVLAGRMLGEELALRIVDVFLNTDFEGGRHKRRIDKIEKMTE